MTRNTSVKSAKSSVDTEVGFESYILPNNIGSTDWMRKIEIGYQLKCKNEPQMTTTRRRYKTNIAIGKVDLPLKIVEDSTNFSIIFTFLNHSKHFFKNIIIFIIFFLIKYSRLYNFNSCYVFMKHTIYVTYIFGICIYYLLWIKKNLECC